jgi:anti-sigma-K factor RskA
MNKDDQADILIAEHALGAEDMKARARIDDILRDNPDMVRRHLEWNEIFDALPGATKANPDNAPDLLDRIEQRITEEDLSSGLIGEVSARHIFQR